MGPDPENRVCDQDPGNPGRPVSSRLQVQKKLDDSSRLDIVEIALVA